MDKKYISVLTALAAAAFLCLLPPQKLYAKEELRIEAVAAVMPELKIYCYHNQEFLDVTNVSYGEEELAVKQVIPYARSGEGSDYYILLDISASTDKAYFNGMKEGILAFWENMKGEDTVTLVTFGEEISVVCSGKTAADKAAESLAALENNDRTTCLFEAVKRAAEMADSREGANRRKTMLILTDGEDFSENTATQKEALADLKEKGIPLYAMAAREIYGRNNEYLADMGEFARSTGGLMEIFDEENVVPKMLSLQELFGKATVIQTAAANNVIDYQSKPLTITYAEGKTISLPYTVSYYTKDQIGPTAAIEKKASNELQIVFSEPVQNAEKNTSYSITLDGTAVTGGYMARYEEGAKPAAMLTFEEELKNGEYEVSFYDITDVSMEENLLKEPVHITVTDGVSSGLTDYLKEYQAFVAGAAVLLVLVPAGAAGWHIIKKGNAVVTVDGKAMLRANVKKKIHVAVEKQEKAGREISFHFEGALTGKQEIAVKVEHSIIVGRSEICDISIEDEKLSRQHFAVHDRNGGFYIEDLHTTNGTLVNGQRIDRLCRLSAGDQINVGELVMTVRW